MKAGPPIQRVTLSPERNADIVTLERKLPDLRDFLVDR
jgi:hypothetical protein